MRTVRRVLTVAIAVVLAAVAVAVIVLRRTVPPLGGEAVLPGLSREVTVRFDRYGIPHISAATHLDAVRALGYLHARDRFFQMDVLRRAAQGRLAELLGAQAVQADRYLRSLDLAGAARRASASVSPESRAIAAAYAEGVNAWLAHARRPVEYLVLRQRMEPWRVEDSWAIGRLEAFDLANSAVEMSLARALADVGAARISELYPVVPDGGAVILDSASGATWAGRGGAPAGGRSRERTARERRSNLAAGWLPSVRVKPEWPPPAAELATALLERSAMRRASNSWVVSGAHTRTGKPMLANDPHLGLNSPSLWYIATLVSGEDAVSGVTIPGLPIVVIGRNRRIAWALTNMEADDLDYVVERLSEDSSHVLTPEGWRPVAVESSTIRVAGGGSVPFVLRRTPHGPVVGAAPPLGPDTAAAGHLVLAMKWNGHLASDEIAAWTQVSRAHDWDSFLAGVGLVRAPEQNWLYADVDGNIGYTASGAIPVRRSGRGLLPTAGWNEEGRWERYLSFDELPRAFNPPSGRLVTANNRIIGPEYPHLITATWAQPYRAERIAMLLQSGVPLTVERMRAIQMDTLDIMATWARTLAARAAEGAGRADLAALLRAWDGTMGADRVEPALFYLWFRALQRLTFEDEVPSGYAPTGVFLGLLRAGSSPWFDDRRTAEVEDFASLSERAMREAVAEARGRRWGELHATLGRHPLGAVRPLNRLLRLNTGPLPRAGSLFTVNVAEFGMRPPFRNTHAPSMRFVADLSEAGAAWFVVTTGQSGHPSSPRYRDQTPLWLNGELIEVRPEGPAEPAAVLVLRGR